MGRTIKPLKGLVLVQQDPPKEKVGGIYLPQNSRDLYEDIGTVLGVGPGVDDLKVGDRVLFKRQPGSALNPDTREGSGEWDNLLMMKEENILAVITEDT